LNSLTLALDAMGGDFGPRATVPAAALALQKFPHLSIKFVGNEAILRPLLAQHQLDSHPRFELIHAPQTVAMDDKPVVALRSRRESSMRLGLELVRRNEALAFVSAGNTGALVAMAKTVLRVLPGVDRPALVSAIPHALGGHSYLLDLGANVSCDVNALFQFALMGAALAETVDGLSQPRVALLNVGSEEIKGNDLVKRTAQLLSDCADVNFTGYIEGNDLFLGKADVIVADGFVGNVALKAAEGLVALIRQRLKQALSRSITARIAALLLKPLIQKELQQLNPDQYNGASLIGLRGIVVKSHGNADVNALVNAIGAAVIEVERQVPERITNKLEAVLLDKHG